jgi:hypothetical protein
MNQDFLTLSRRLATDDYLRLYCANVLRVQKQGATSKEEKRLVKIVEAAEKAGVSSTPYESRNSPLYLKQCTGAGDGGDAVTMLLGDWQVCNDAATEYRQCVELTATPAYCMAYYEHRNGGGGDSTEQRRAFSEAQRRLARAGVSLHPYETKRSPEYEKNVALLMRPVALFA